jgi:hypothetical protein
MMVGRNGQWWPGNGSTDVDIIVVVAVVDRACHSYVIESASRPLVGFGVLNNNLIKGLISFIKCISMFLMKV